MWHIRVLSKHFLGSFVFIKQNFNCTVAKLLGLVSGEYINTLLGLWKDFGAHLRLVAVLY